MQRLALLEDLFLIIHNAVNLSNVANYMCNQNSNSPVFNYRFVPFMSSVSAVMLSAKSLSPCREDQISVHNLCLDNVLKSWKMVRKQIIGDGNCCFRAVASSLIANHKSILDQLPAFFTSIGIADVDNLSQTQFAMKQREITVNEWQSNPQEYEAFLPHQQQHESHNCFLKVDTSIVT